MIELFFLQDIDYDFFQWVDPEIYDRGKEVVKKQMGEDVYIVQARHKYIIDMLEDIRVAWMERMFDKKQMMVNSNDNICSKIRKKLEDAKVGSRVCTSRPNGELKFKVRLLDDRYIVDFNEKSCSCKLWNLTGIPCIHTISCIN